MRRVASMIVVMAFLSISLLGSSIKLIEPADAIRLIGNKGIVFVSGESAESYQKAHIIGSISMPACDLYGIAKAEDLSCAPLYRCPKEAEEYIRNKGIGNSQMVIAYDLFPGSDAVALYSFFETMGHKNLKILNGGLASIRALDPNQLVCDELQAERKSIMKQAEAADQEDDIDKEEDLESQAENIKAKMNLLESQLLIRDEVEAHKRSDYLLASEKFNMDFIADNIEARQVFDDILKDGNESISMMIDMRCADEGVAEDAAEENYTPGVTYVNWKDITDFEKNKRFKSAEEMQRVFDEAGVNRGKKLYVYCRNDASRSAYIAMALRLLGYTHVKRLIDDKVVQK